MSSPLSSFSLLPGVRSWTLTIPVVVAPRGKPSAPTCTLHTPSALIRTPPPEAGGRFARARNTVDRGPCTQSGRAMPTGQRRPNMAKQPGLWLNGCIPIAPRPARPGNEQDLDGRQSAPRANPSPARRVRRRHFGTAPHARGWCCSCSWARAAQRFDGRHGS